MERSLLLGSVAFTLLCFFTSAFGDTPANCTYESIAGTWTFYVGKTGYDNTIDCCSNEIPVQNRITIELKFPDIALDEYGTEGFWTLIYNQGFEVVINNKKYFAFSAYAIKDKTVISYCDTTFNGWSHDIHGYNWACFYGKRNTETVSHSSKSSMDVLDGALMNRKYMKNMDFIYSINNKTKLWKAAYYPEYESMTLKERLSRAGSRVSSGILPHPPTVPVTSEHIKLISSLPENFDWRDQEGVNYVSPIRNQEKCGSCYAFGSMAMLEARVRLLSHNTLQPVFSTQDVVSCSKYSQGCEGGFPYLIAGKYGQDFGVVEESCFPYTGNDTTSCQTETPGCLRYRTAEYHYIGEFYGGCNEALMMDELVRNGPIAISFEVTEDFQHYKSGIYHKTGLQDGFNPWEITNHVVAVVGYGVEDGEKYWIVKNSWGVDWGEEGFFRIRKGTDELSIESMAVAATPVIP